MITCKIIVQATIQCTNCGCKTVVINDNWKVDDVCPCPDGWMCTNYPERYSNNLDSYEGYSVIDRVDLDEWEISTGPEMLLCPTCYNIKDVLE
jgi:hypothetical protein